MKQLFKLLFLIAYTFVIFLVSSPLALGGIFVVNLTLIIILKVRLKHMLFTAYKISFFIGITFILNIFLADIQTAILILIRLILSFTFVYPYRKIISPMQLGMAVETLFKPAKIFKVNPTDISLIVNISVTFVPILARELEEINSSLKAKCIQVYKWNQTHKKLQYRLMPFLYGVFERTNSLEMALKSKGYTE